MCQVILVYHTFINFFHINLIFTRNLYIYYFSSYTQNSLSIIPTISRLYLFFRYHIATYSITSLSNNLCSFASDCLLSSKPPPLFLTFSLSQADNFLSQINFLKYPIIFNRCYKRQFVFMDFGRIFKIF